jgi:hypothetical protein
MFLTHDLQIVTQWDFISEVQISESGYKHAAATILSITSGIWDKRNTQAVTAVAASRVSFSVICYDQECPLVCGPNIL